MTDTSQTTGEMLDNLNALDVPDLKDPNIYYEDNRYSLATILSGFSIMLQTFLTDITPYIENVAPNLKQNVVLCGIDMVKNVFSEVSLYTRNVLTACQITRYAMSLYFEFVSQITDGQFRHIQLSVRDTMMFVYKQTLFKLHDEKRSSYSATKEEQDQNECLIHYSRILIALCDDTITRVLKDDKCGKEMAMLSDNIHCFDESISKLFVYDGIDTVGMMTSLHNVADCLLKKNIRYDTSLNILTRIISFYRHKISRGIMPEMVVKRINDNCRRIAVLDTPINDVTDSFVMELTRI
jgi:hypothetical protein